MAYSDLNSFVIDAAHIIWTSINFSLEEKIRMEIYSRKKFFQIFRILSFWKI